MRLHRLLCPVLLALPWCAPAQIVGVALEPKAVIGDGTPVVGGATVVASPKPDRAAFIDFSPSQPRLLGEVDAPTSYLGPPSAVAISSDRRLALVAASSRLDPAQAKFVPDRRVTVIDLTASPLRAVQTLELDASPTSLAMSPDGRSALVLHTAADRATVLALDSRAHSAKVAGQIAFPAGSGPLSAAFSPDGRRLLVTRAGDHRVSLYAVDDSGVRVPAIRDLVAGVRPFAVSFCGAGGHAVVSNFGDGDGDADTVSLLRLDGAAPRTVDTVSVGPVPEGVACSPDGRYAAAAIQNLSNRPKSHPFYGERSAVVLLKIENERLLRLDRQPIGAWSQGVAFLDDSRTLVAQSIADRALHRFRIEADRLRPAGAPIVFESGGPASMGVSGR